jgi:1,4-dihydroxy-2-naphthoyl-CoA hydrolase
MKLKLKIYPLEELNKLAKNTMLEALDIKITAVGEDFIEATMPVDKRTHQPYGILHGGASVALAESLGSMGAMLTLDQSKFHCVGIDINANHMKAVRSGKVKGRAIPIHTGRTTQVWQIEIKNELNELVCISRLTMAVVPIVTGK